LGQATAWVSADEEVEHSRTGQPLGLSDYQYALGRFEWLVVLPRGAVPAWMPFKTRTQVAL